MVNIDPRNNKPIYEQIIEQIKYSVIKGYLQPGDSMPSVRKMALELSVTPGTVAKAYQELERQKVIETIRGKGAFIAEGTEMKPDAEKLERIRENIRSQIVELRYMGVDKSEVKKMIDELYSK